MRYSHHVYTRQVTSWGEVSSSAVKELIANFENNNRILFQATADACRCWWRGCGGCTARVLCSPWLVVCVYFVTVDTIIIIVVVVTQNVTEVKGIMPETSKLNITVVKPLQHILPDDLQTNEQCQCTQETANFLQMARDVAVNTHSKTGRTHERTNKHNHILDEGLEACISSSLIIFVTLPGSCI